MKSYTDLEQSKKLAEFLPLESSDFGWNVFVDDTTRILPINDWDLVKDCSGNVKFYHAWSLAALLGVLPDHFYDETGRKTLGMDKGDTYYNIFYENKNSYIQKRADNPVDACYELILKLHEHKLL